jgi:hypothetical protein
MSLYAGDVCAVTGMNLQPQIYMSSKWTARAVRYRTCKKLIWMLPVLQCGIGYTFDDDHVNGARLRLYTAATNGPIFLPPSDIWVWRATVEWYWLGKTPDSFTRALWQSYGQSYISNSEENDKFGRTYFVRSSKCSLKSYDVRPTALLYVLWIFIALKN